MKEGLADAVMEELRRYGEVSSEEMYRVARKVASEGTKRLKETSPKGRGSRKGHYADGWTVTAIRKNANEFSFVVHNRKKPGLTHLLENGHVLRGGGRARAFPHIKAVEEWCAEEYLKRVERMLS
jgi:hypothetical protein